VDVVRVPGSSVLKLPMPRGYCVLPLDGRDGMELGRVTGRPVEKCKGGTGTCGDLGRSERNAFSLCGLGRAHSENDSESAAHQQYHWKGPWRRQPPRGSLYEIRHERKSGGPPPPPARWGRRRAGDSRPLVAQPLRLTLRPPSRQWPSDRPTRLHSASLASKGFG